MKKERTRFYINKCTSLCLKVLAKGFLYFIGIGMLIILFLCSLPFIVPDALLNISRHSYSGAED